MLATGHYLGVLQSARSPEEANRLLFENYCQNEAWKGAFALIDQLMDQPIEPALYLKVGRTDCSSRGDYSQAAGYQARLVAYLRTRVSQDQVVKMPLAAALSELAWYQELCGQFPEALKSAEGAEGLNSAKEASALQLKYAHALLFAGQYAKAAAIYQKHQGKDFADGRKWTDEILHDFKLLCEQGYTHPEMPKIDWELNRRKNPRKRRPPSNPQVRSDHGKIAAQAFDALKGLWVFALDSNRLFFGREDELPQAHRILRERSHQQTLAPRRAGCRQSGPIHADWDRTFNPQRPCSRSKYFGLKALWALLWHSHAALTQIVSGETSLCASPRVSRMLRRTSATVSYCVSGRKA